MNSEHRYILEPYKGMSSRYRCPSCRYKGKTFSLYIDTETKIHVGDRVGRCERVDKCGYHYTPKQHFAEVGIQPELTTYAPRLPQIKPKPSFISPYVFKKSLNAYESNKLVVFLKTLFDKPTVERLIQSYYLGTSNHWTGSTVFWQIDKAGKIRTGKIMLYDQYTGKRVKQPYNHISWAHKALGLENYNLNQCLFGEHLLNQNSKPAAVVESEKTALIASAYLPCFNWLACGSLQNLSYERCAVLKDRKTMLYPDLNAFDKWSKKAEELNFNVSPILEQIATAAERGEGLDLADYLITSNRNADKLGPAVNTIHTRITNDIPF